MNEKQSDLQSKKQNYIILPVFLLEDKTLSHSEMILFADIISHSALKGYCWCGNAAFAKKYSVDENTVSRWITSLVKKNLITRQIIYIKGTKQVQERRLYINTENPELKNYMDWYNQFSKSPATEAEDTADTLLNTSSNPVDPPVYKTVEDNNKFMNIFLNDLNIHNTSLSEENYHKLVRDFGKELVDNCLKEFSFWKTDKQAHPKSDFDVLLNWIHRKTTKTVTHETSYKNFKTAYKPRMSAVQESGCDKVTKEMLEAVPF